MKSEVIDQVLEDPESLTLGGEKKELTVFFSDVRKFTTISESLTPEKLCELMNDYFTPMTYYCAPAAKGYWISTSVTRLWPFGAHPLGWRIPLMWVVMRPLPCSTNWIKFVSIFPKKEASRPLTLELA